MITVLNDVNHLDHRISSCIAGITTLGVSIIYAQMVVITSDKKQQISNVLFLGEYTSSFLRIWRSFK